MSALVNAVADAICKRRNANDWPRIGLDFDEEMARVALSALAAAGYAVVPREPTEAMQEAAYTAWANGPPLTIVGEAVNAYRAMLAAAEEPKP